MTARRASGALEIWHWKREPKELTLHWAFSVTRRSVFERANKTGDDNEQSRTGNLILPGGRPGRGAQLTQRGKGRSRRASHDKFRLNDGEHPFLSPVGSRNHTLLMT